MYVSPVSISNFPHEIQQHFPRQPLSSHRKTTQTFGGLGVDLGPAWCCFRWPLCLCHARMCRPGSTEETGAEPGVGWK